MATEPPDGYIRCADLGEIVRADLARTCDACKQRFCPDCVWDIDENENGKTFHCGDCIRLSDYWMA